MKEIKAGPNEAGQRLDKLLLKYLNQAGYGFIQKMLRKKNITLNDHKATGKEILAPDDSIKIYFSDDTLNKFAVHLGTGRTVSDEYRKWSPEIIYEDADVLILNKPVGMLSQRAKPEDYSLVDWVLDHMLEQQEISGEERERFKPGICNRLDRNTSGIVVAGKTLGGLQYFNQLFKDRTIHKYYRCLTFGTVQEVAVLDGYLIKDPKTNRVTLIKTPREGASKIRTSWRPVETGNLFGIPVTLLEVELITGKPHQIRSHLASIGHPIVGDYKYGSRQQNDRLRKNLAVTSQLLHAYRLEMPSDTPEAFRKLAGKIFTAEVPGIFMRAVENMRSNI